MILTKLDEIVKIAVEKPTQRLAIAASADIHVLEAVKMATEMNIIHVTICSKGQTF